MYSASIKSESYSRTIAYLSFMTSLCAFGCILLGYLVLPFASAFYAALLFFEKKEKRFFAYFIPVLAFVANFALRGFSLIGLMSLEGVAFAIVGLIIYFSYILNQSKASCAFYTTAATVLMICISAIFLAFTSLKSFGSSAIVQFFSHLYSATKNIIVNSLLAITDVTEEGMRYFLLNSYDAQLLFDQLIILLIPFVIIFAFVISGISLKVFSSIIERRLETDATNTCWSFKTSNFVAIFYLVVSIVSFLSYGANDLISVSISILSTIFMAVYAYLGFNFARLFFISKFKNSTFVAMAFIFAFLLLSSYLFQILSYVGVYYTISSNKVDAKEQ